MPHNARVPTLLPTLLASDRAPSPRTLVDIFREVVDFAPQSSGRRQRRRGPHLCRARRGRRRSSPPAGRGRRPRRRQGRRADQVRHHRPLRRHPRDPARRCGLRAGRRRRPRRAGPGGVRRVRGRRGRSATSSDRAAARRPGAGAATSQPALEPATGRRRLGHLHLAARPARRRAWRSPTATPPRSSTPSRGCSSQDEPDRPRRPRDGRPVGRLRRELRGDVAGLGVRRLPGPGAAIAGAQRRRRRAVAGRQRHHRRLHRPDPGGAVAGRRRWTRCGC